MLDDQTRQLVELAVFASRPEYGTELAYALERAKATTSRDEVYEVFLQQYLFVGFPSAIEGMKALHKVWPSETPTEPVEEVDYSAFLDRGQELYQRIYTKNAEVVRDEMLRLSPELALWAVSEGYGKTLSRDALDMKTRELCIVGVLSQLGWKRQLFSHIMGALNVGATRDEVKAAIVLGCYEFPERLAKAFRLLDKA